MRLITTFWATWYIRKQVEHSSVSAGSSGVSCRLFSNLINCIQGETRCLVGWSLLRRLPSEIHNDNEGAFLSTGPPSRKQKAKMIKLTFALNCLRDSDGTKQRVFV